MIDVKLPGLGRLQITSGVVHKSAYDLRRNAIVEAWALGGVWADAVRALAARRFDVSEFMAARTDGEPAIRRLLETKGAEPLAVVVRDYLKQAKASDVAKMRQRLTRFAKALGTAPSVADVTPAAIDAFLNALTDQRTAKTTKTPAKGSTVNRYRAVIGGLCTWAVRTGRMRTHPIAGKQVEKRPEPHHRLPELSADEYRDYMAFVRQARPDLAVILLLLIHTAPDVGELFDVMAKDADLETARMRYERSKTKRYGPAPRFVPMPALVLAEVRAHVAEHGVRGSQKLFGMLKRSDVEWLHDRAAQAIQRPELTLKDLRHVAAIAWVKAGVHIRLVQRWLGHRSLAMTMKYTDYEPGAEMAVEMAERAAQTLNRSVDVTPLKAAR
jgi:integrase/recombinase XerD